ncbi:Uncharacterized protein dnm_071490 [Desulfonema magnum]|uniref:Uncharacterized protein n=1 Tax=Desulfonema magnum TaxID=45655 RepID=A0A975BSN6_9BACT|nr:Uncharacterized protein dnm_071490 [Desulfonema magnum]
MILTGSSDVRQFFKLFFGQIEKWSRMILMRPVFPNFTPSEPIWSDISSKNLIIG